MIWDKVNFGKNKKVQEKTLPQILFIDPDWFYYQYELKDSYLRKKFGTHADDIYKKSQIIRPKEGHYIKYFLFCDNTSDGFCPISIEKAVSNFSEYIGTGAYGQNTKELDAQKFKILKKLDLRFPKSLNGYDKKSYKNFIREFKDYLFDGKNITEKKAIEFFENNENFIL